MKASNPPEQTSKNAINNTDKPTWRTLTVFLSYNFVSELFRFWNINFMYTEQEGILLPFQWVKFDMSRIGRNHNPELCSTSNGIHSSHHFSNNVHQTNLDLRNCAGTDNEWQWTLCFKLTSSVNLSWYVTYCYITFSAEYLSPQKTGKKNPWKSVWVITKMLLNNDSSAANAH